MECCRPLISHAQRISGHGLGLMIPGGKVTRIMAHQDRANNQSWKEVGSKRQPASAQYEARSQLWLQHPAQCCDCKSLEPSDVATRLAILLAASRKEALLACHSSAAALAEPALLCKRGWSATPTESPIPSTIV